MLWIKKHFAAITLIALAVVVAPAYVAAMETQMIDFEFLAALCGFAGWGPQG